MRCFIALEFPPEIKSSIYRSLKREIKDKPELKWVSEENLHITLKFLGEVPDKKVPAIGEQLEKIFKGDRRVKIKLGELQAFLDRGEVRVLWIGIAEGEDKIKKYANELEKSLSKMGFKKEKREFVPHLTIARARKNSRKKFKPEDFNIKLNIPDFFVDEIVLFKSTLTPSGPIYEKIKVVKLNG